MAYAALVSLAQNVYQLLNHVSIYEMQDLLSMKKCVILLQQFLEDFPDKAHDLEGRIRDIANEAEDTIECIMWEQFHSRRGRRTYLFHELKKVTNKIELLAKQVMNIKNSFGIKDEKQLSDAPAATSSSRLAPIHKDVMIGFDDDLLAIKARLCGGSSQRQVIPIIGMRGIGKTTLARNAYDDPLIMEYFDIRAWVTVSQDYHAEEILSGLLASMEEFNMEKSGESNKLVEEKVYKNLKGRRYLIVMDDMWSTNAWDDLKMVFADDNNGSRIMLTTRISDVAAYPNPCGPLHEMRLMDEDQSWNLLRQTVFGQQDCPPELENIGKQIARSCRGLPLAIGVIAGLLSNKAPASWGEIAENINSTVSNKDGHFEEILFLSYTHLPHHLRPCFLYMGVFPEDYEIRVSKLVKLWVAEGFLKCENRDESLEEAAEAYLEDLVKRSLIFVRKRKSNGKIKSCSVHDLVRDLCIRKAQEDKFLLHAEKILPESTEIQRRVSFVHFDEDCLANIFDSTIRSMKCFQCRKIAASSFGNYKLLRVFVVVGTTFVGPRDKFFYFPVQVFQLFHLRYLDFYYYNDLPVAKSNLQNLQTLIIRKSNTSRDYPPDKMVCLPWKISTMPQLRHLNFFGSLPCLEEGTLALENLQTLSLATNLRCTKRVLEKIPNLKKLGIFYYGDEYEGDYHLENLVCLHQLEKLKIKIYANFPYRQKLNAAFPMTLKKLTLSGWRLPWERMTTVGSLPNLEVLVLRDFSFRGSTWETNEGEFLQLKFLLIDKSVLQHWITESSHFPRLKSLLLHRCWCLTKIPDDIGEIPTLELIDVDKRIKSLVESAQRIQEQQADDGLQIRLVKL